MIILAIPTPQGRTHVELNGGLAVVTAHTDTHKFATTKNHSDLHTFADDPKMSAL